MSDRLSFPKEKIRILLLEGIHPNAVEAFRREGYTRVRREETALSPSELRKALSSAHMVGIRSRTRLDAEAFAAAPRLMAVGCFCIGTNQVDLEAAARQGIPVFNAPHSNTRSVAELVVAEMVMLLRGLGDKNTAAHQGRWTKSSKNSYELRGKTLGIVGYGHIGSQVSILAEALGMRVVYYDIVPKLPMGNASQLPSLEDVLARADIVTLHVPEDPSTRLLMNEERLRLLRPGACLINASRGSVVDVDALAELLREGRLLGAAIDVFPVEPKSNDEELVTPLRGLPNVILTPHIGGSTREAQFNIGAEVARKLIQFSDTGSTVGAVNFPNLSLRPNENSHRLLHIHRNQPGMLGQINQALAEAEANILGQHLETTRELGYVVIDIDRAHGGGLRERLEAIPGTIRVRVLY
ncbi:MAG: phosphoglycerate dehydrogenase [Planctomycetota bacterium]|nr:MAG: phosphoglycerate dehydrogenase [Planctomycetota bacterium]